MASSTSIESELQQRASILAVDNAGLRSQLESANAELRNLRSRLVELESTRAKLVSVPLNFSSSLTKGQNKLVFVPGTFSLAWCHFHQHFMGSFCTKILLPKNYKPKL
jgi:hypothetical protein